MTETDMPILFSCSISKHIFTFSIGLLDYPEFNAQVPAKGPYYQEEGPHCISTEFKIRRI